MFQISEEKYNAHETAYGKLRGNLKEEDYDRFHGLKCDEKIRYVYDLLGSLELFPKISTKSNNNDRGVSYKKCLEEAADFKQLGNKAHAAGKYEQALEYYTRSIALYPEGSEELPLAYGNRSAVLFQLQRYTYCLKDIEYAGETAAYPVQKSTYKLFVRKGKCFLHLRKYELARKALREAMNALTRYNSNKDGEDNDVMKPIRDNLGKLLEECSSAENKSRRGSCILGRSEGKEFTARLPEMPKIENINELMPQASQSIQIAYAEKMGNHIVATKDIYPGEILAVEKPYESVLLPDYYGTHCYNCFLRCAALIPCAKCSLVMYCSEDCREKSWNPCHEIECEILPHVINAGFEKMELLAIRILIRATKGGKLTGKMRRHEIYGKPFARRSSVDTAVYTNNNTTPPRNNCNDDEDDGNDASNNLERDLATHMLKYSAIHNLQDNYSAKSTKNVLKKISTASYLLNIFKRGTFFTKSIDGNDPDTSDIVTNDGNKRSDDLKCDSKRLSPNEIYAGVLLVKYLCVISCNAHEVTEMKRNELRTNNNLLDSSDESRDSPDIDDSLEIGAALYPLVSLWNHSCDPHVVRHSYSTSVVLRCIKPVKANEQIMDNYGFHYAVHPVKHRQSCLNNQYHFQCQCEACVHNWPLYDDLSPIRYNHSGNEKFDKKKLRKFLEKIKTSDIRAKDFDKLLHYINLLHKCGQYPSKEICICQEALKYYLGRRANFYT